MLSSTVLVALVVAQGVRSEFDLGFQDDSDLTKFVSRPDIKAPLFNVEIFDKHGIEPGYWFVGPYVSINQHPFAPNYYQPCQTGPHIYNGNGDLIWSGACIVRNANTCDFRVFEHNNSYFMSGIVYSTQDDPKGHGIILDNTYSVVKYLNTTIGSQNFNMHELNVIPSNYAAIHFISRCQYVDVTEVSSDVDTGWIINIGFREVDIADGRTLFEWWAYDYDHVRLSESTAVVDSLEGPPPSKAWNWFHGNSLDKNAEGDYLISARFTDCIYKISGEDGSIVWRLGGSASSFPLDGFQFSRQHDARWHTSNNKDKEIVSLLDNASDSISNTSSVSSVLLIELDLRTMTARLLNRWPRPDGNLSRLRGSAQILPSGNVFTGWSDNAYITEHSGDGRLLMSARFRSERFVTYRAHKFNITATPAEPIMLKAYIYGTSHEASTSVFYVSWNGATEVDTWRFLRPGTGSTNESTLIGTKRWTGFETMFQSPGYEKKVYVEALNVDGMIVGTSATHEVSCSLALDDDKGGRGVVTEQLHDIKDDETISWKKSEL